MSQYNCFRKYFRNILSAALGSITLLTAAQPGSQEQQQLALFGKPGTYEVSLIIEPSTLKDALSSRFPSLFNGRRECSLIPLEVARNFGRAALDPSFLFKDSEKRRVAGTIRDEISKISVTYPAFKSLVNEIDQDLIQDNLNPLGLFSYTFQVPALITAGLSTDPQALPQYQAEVYFILKQEIERRERLLARWDSFYPSIEGGLTPITPANLKQLHELLRTKFEQSARPLVYYPVFGKSKLGLATLVEGYIQRVYPVAIPYATEFVHGIEHLPLAFTSHDYQHAYSHFNMVQDRNYQATRKILFELASVKKTPSDLIPPVANFMTAQSNLFEDTLQDLLNLYFTFTLPRQGVKTVKQAMVGLFYLIHEEMFALPASIYRVHNLDQVLEIFMRPLFIESDARKREKFYRQNLLQVDLITGKFDLTPQQIAEALLAAGVPPMDGELDFKHLDNLKDQAYHIDLEDTLTDVEVNLSIEGTGNYKWFVKKLSYILADSQDKLSLFKAAGFDIKYPTPEELHSKNGHAIAIAYLEQTDKGLRDCYRVLRHTAAELVGVVPAGETRSLWQRYWDKSQAIERKFKQIIAQID
ncbi:hypothetical protein [Candidatus Odyssella thessalonicensis]|uniref:hypothetical protein n=1 Tax=Candidatus Odyssella thessalonicensis TaxID=84647 RepID=UPI000225B941|nr:hypothetical protein [Candidatus Odyssella thessalonicensis]